MSKTNTHRSQLTREINKIRFESEQGNLLLARVFNEAFLSDFLAWCLDSKANHGWNSKFLKAFVKLIAQRRCDSDVNYKRLSSTLKHGQQGVGQLASELKVANATVIRELHFARDSNTGTNFLDIAILDFDKEDDFIITIENKLFGQNSKNQLEMYRAQVNQRYKRANVQEFVYLTFDGRSPTRMAKKTQSIWVQLSWLDDILPLLRELKSKETSARVKDVITALEWAKGLRGSFDSQLIDDLKRDYLQVISNLFLYDLKRYIKTPSKWSIESISDKRIDIHHSSTPRSKLHLTLMRNYDIAFGGNNRQRELFCRCILPFGMTVNQLLNMSEFFIRQMYLDTTKVSWSADYIARHRNNSKYLTDFPADKKLLIGVNKCKMELKVVKGVFG